jgi:hypothetical protein
VFGLPKYTAFWIDPGSKSGYNPVNVSPWEFDEYFSTTGISNGRDPAGMEDRFPGSAT